MLRSGGGARLTEDEEVLTGQVKMIIYLKYIQAIGILTFTINLLTYFVSEVALGPVLRIHDILVWIRIVSADLCL
jgi:hypothetical protein